MAIMATFNCFSLVTVVSIITLLRQDVSCIHRWKDQGQTVRSNHLSEAIEIMFGSDDKTSPRVLFHPSCSIDSGIIPDYTGSYEVCSGNIFDCVKNDFRLTNIVVVVISREGFLNLVKRFPVSFEHGLDLIKIVIFDESHDALEVCNWVGSSHNATVAAGRDGIRLCFGSRNTSPKTSWSALSGRNVILGCGTVLGRDLCTMFRVKVLDGALAAINATVDHISLNDIDLRSAREKVDALGLLAAKHSFCPSFVIEPELKIDISIYVYVDVGKMQRKSFFGNIVADFKISAFLFLISISVAALFLVLNERLAKNRLGDLFLLLISLALARAVQVSSRCIRQHSRRVLVSFWALGCLVFVVYVQCLITSKSCIPTNAEQKDLDVVGKHISTDPGGKLCSNGEVLVYAVGGKFEVLAKLIARVDRARNMIASPSCIMNLNRVKRGGVTLLDTLLCDIKKELGSNMFKVAEGVFAVHGGIPISRNSCRNLALKAVLRRIYETGWFDREHMRATRTCPTVNVETEVHIFFQIFFVAYLWCCTACVLVFLLECVVVRLKAVVMSLYYGNT